LNKEYILYIGGFELPDKNAAAHRVLSNAKALRDSGKNVILVGINKDLPKGTKMIDTYVKISEFDTYAIPYPSGMASWAKNIVDIKPYIELCQKYGTISTIICYNFPAIALDKLRRYCFKNSINCIADVTEWYSVEGRNIVVKIVKGMDVWYRMRIVHKKLDGLLVISRFLENYYRNCKNNLYIPALVDTQEEKWKANYEKSDSVLKLVYAGSPGYKDRIDVLIEALRFVKRNYILDIIGITKEQYLSMYPQHKAFLKASSSINFHGRLKHLDTLQYVKKANYSCFFRMNDRMCEAGFPTKFVESITCGTPVITNKVSNLDEYMKENENGVLLKKIDSRKIAELIERIDFTMSVNRKLFDYSNFQQEIQKFLIVISKRKGR